MISVIVPYIDEILKGRCVESITTSVHYGWEIRTMSDINKEGPAVLRNRMARKAIGDIYFFIDSDAIVYPDTLKRIEEHFKDLKVDGVTIVWDKVPIENNFFNKFKALEMNHTMNHYFLRACASNGTAIRKEVFWAVGGFNEKYQEACVEDFHFGLKVFKAGYNIVFDKTILMQHSFCNSTFEGLKKYSKRAFERAKLLVEMDVESSYNSKKIKLLYVSTLFPPLFILLNIGLFKRFFKYGWWFFIRASLLYYFYVVLVAICGLVGYLYAWLYKIFLQ